MRVLLFTGKGGVGKTSVAAATGVRAASAGLRVLVMSADPAHSLADAFDVELSSEPVEVAPGLEAEQLDARRRLEERWRDVRAYLVSLLSWGGLDEVAAEELSLPPGVEELFALTDVRRHVEAGAHDLLIVDCAPTAETLRLLSLPDALSWYLRRVFPVQRRLTAAARPALGRVTSMPLPSDGVFGAVAELDEAVRRVREILTDAERTSVRLVVNPERMVLAEAQRTYTTLCLFGYQVDAVVVNRLLPEEVGDPYFDRWKVRQRRHLDTVRERFAGLPLLSVPLLEDEPLGVAALGRLAARLYDGVDPAAVLCRDELLRVEREPGGYVLGLRLPLAAGADVDVLRRGHELYVKVAGHTRCLALPRALSRGELAGARVEDGRLEVRFRIPSAEGGRDGSPAAAGGP